MAQTKRKPAAAKPAAQTSTPANNPESGAEAAGSAAATAQESPMPQEVATPPEAAAQVSAPAAQPTPPAEPIDQVWTAQETDIVRVRTVNRKPRRRAGRAFGADAVEIAVDELSDDDLAALLSDPFLAVEGI